MLAPVRGPAGWPQGCLRTNQLSVREPAMQGARKKELPGLRTTQLPKEKVRMLESSSDTERCLGSVIGTWVWGPLGCSQHLE